MYVLTGVAPLDRSASSCSASSLAYRSAKPTAMAGAVSAKSLLATYGVMPAAFSVSQTCRNCPRSSGTDRPCASSMSLFQMKPKPV